MAISISLPLQAMQYIATANVFNAPFNTIEQGKYSFNQASNVKQLVMPLEINSHYMIERMFVSGNVGAEDFTSSLDLTSQANIPTVQLSTSKGITQIHNYPIPVIQFTQNRESPILIYSDKKDDTLVITMTGVLNQITNTVGIDPMILVVGFSIYKINEKYFTQGFRTAVSPDYGLGKKSF